MHDPLYPGGPRATRQPVVSIRLVLLLLAAMLLAACGQGNSAAPSGAEHAPRAESVHAESGHDESGDDESAPIRLAPDELAALGITLATAAPGTLAVTRTFPGKVRLNEERQAHVVARVAGVVASVSASTGDEVTAGQTLAVLESRELARATAEYLGAKERQALARDHFQRLDRLFAQGIATEREHLQARQAEVEARIEAKAAEHGLRALGFSERWISRLPAAPESARFRYPLRAPIGGVVLERHLTRGEAVAADAEAFEIADLSAVWVDIDIFQRDMATVREGQQVRIAAGELDAVGTVSWVRPIVAEDTRAALARVILPNPEGNWKPGMFVEGRVTLERVEAPLVVARSALQTIEDETVVFVETPDGLVPQTVVIGTEGVAKVAVHSGLEAGQRYVAAGAFTLKAELAKGSFEAGHSH